MQTHGPKRVYNLSALESWFNRLTGSWEPHFSAGSLEMGRKLYRDGLIREIALGETDAIIHSKIDGKECYAVIDWSHAKPTTRSSVEEGPLGQALAIAGLYEIEEMVVEEISPLPAEREECPGGEVRLEERLIEVKKDEAPGRPLHLVFTVAASGLVFDASWVEADKTRVQALAHGSNGHLGASEREAVIRLASLARKGHFRFCQETLRYILAEVPNIQFFLKQEVTTWKKFFQIELDPSVSKLLDRVKPIQVEARAQSHSSGNLSLEWIFRAGEKMLSKGQAEALLKGDGETVLLPGMGFVQLNREKSEAVQDWKKKTGGNRSKQTLPKYLLMSLFAEERIHIEADPAVEAWRQQLLAPPRPVKNLPDYLRQYQREGVQWMSHLCDADCHGLLADEMGLGKTVQVISLLAARPTNAVRHLVVAPASVVPVWQQELARFSPDLPVQVLRSGNTFADEGAGEGVWLASYTQLRRHAELLKKVEFGYAVLDEGQLIKNPDAKITRCCFSIRAQHRLVLTGTPLENRQLDLWSLFHFLMPHLLGSRAAFEAAIAHDAEGFVKRLRKQLAPFVLRRIKEKVASELPRKIEMTLIAPLTDRQRDEYGRICREGLNRLGDSLSDTMRERSFGLFSLLTRLRQVCCDPGLLPWSNDPWEESGKINLLLENLSAVVEGGHKVVIFSQFVALLKRVEQALDLAHPDLRRFVLTGSTLDRQVPVEEFQNCAGPALMLVSLRAGGTGITLHAADYVFLLDPWWNPAVEAQAIDRVHRIGQEKTVFVYRLVTGGTVEERIQELKEQKRDLFDSVIGGMGGAGDLRETYASLKDLIELDDL